jgi:hypothetical protein
VTGRRTKSIADDPRVVGEATCGLRNWRGDKILAKVRELAATHTVEAIEALVRIMYDPNENARTRVAAASAILDRACAKPSKRSHSTRVTSGWARRW